MSLAPGKSEELEGSVEELAWGGRKGQGGGSDWRSVGGGGNGEGFGVAWMW